MANEFIHKAVGAVLTQAEFENVDQHVLNSQATGDLIHAVSATSLERLGIGNTDDLLTVVGGLPAWVASGGGSPHAIDSHNDIGAITEARGMILHWTAASEWDGLPIGASGTFLTSDGSDPLWQSVADLNLVTAAAAITTNSIVKGAGTKAVQDSGILIDANDNVTSMGSLAFKASTILTIVSGDVTFGQSYHRIAGEGAADDDLVGINGGSVTGRLLIIRPSLDSVTITVKHNGSPGAVDNILLNGDIDYVMDDEDDALFLVYDLSLDTNGAWIEISRGAGVVSLTGIETLTNKTLTTPTIADLTNATHDHSNNVGGGTFSILNTTGTLTVARGGTGITSVTDGGIVLGSGSGALSVTARPTTGQILVGAASGDPVPVALSGDVSAVSAAGSVTISATHAGTAHKTVLDSLDNVAAITEAQGQVLFVNSGGNWTILAPGSSGDFLQTQGAAADPQWATPAGSGDVTGPAAAVDNEIVRYDGTTGKTIQAYTSGGPTISDTGLISFTQLITGLVAGNVLSLQNSTDGASNQVGILSGGNRATAVDNDEAFLTLRLDDDLGALTEFVRLTWKALDVTNDSKDSRPEFQYFTANTLRELSFPPITSDDVVVVEALAQTLANKTLTTPTISSTGFINAQHAHAAANSGGTIGHSATTGQGVDDHHNELHAAGHADGGADELAVQDLASNAATDGQVAKADGAGAVAFEDDEAGVNFIIDGGESAITTGVKGDVEMPFAGVITAARLFADQTGSIVIDIFKDTFANFPPTVADTITASAKPTISSGVKDEDATLTGWTTTFAKGDILRFNVDSITTIERCTVSLSVRKT